MSQYQFNLNIYVILDFPRFISLDVSNKRFNFLLQVEYQVEPCSKGYNSSACIDVRKTSFPMQTGGYVIYGVGHQHVGANESTLYGQVILE